MIEDRERALALMSGRCAGRSGDPAELALEGRAWRGPPGCRCGGIRWPIGGPATPTAARTTTKSPSGWEAIAPSAGKTVRTDVGKDAEHDVGVRRCAGDVALGLDDRRCSRSRHGVMPAGASSPDGPAHDGSAGRHGHVLPIGMLDAARLSRSGDTRGVLPGAVLPRAVAAGEDRRTDRGGARMRSTMQETPLSIATLVRYGTTRARVGRGGHLDGRRRPLRDVRRGRPPGGPARPRPARARRHRRRPGRHVHVEQPGAPGGLPRGAGDGRGAAPAEHPALPRPARLHRRPRRGQGGPRRRLGAAGAREGPAASCRRSSTWSSTARPTCRCSRASHATVHAYEELLAGRPEEFDWVGARRRDRGRGHVLHERHHRQPQGRRLQPPVDLPALDAGLHARRLRRCGSPTGCC